MSSHVIAGDSADFDGDSVQCIVAEFNFQGARLFWEICIVLYGAMIMMVWWSYMS